MYFSIKKMKKFLFKCEEKDKNKRIDKFLYENIVTAIKNISRGKVQELIKTNLLKKNNVIFNDSSYRIKNGDVLEIEVEDEEKKLTSKNIDLDIVYEDNDLIVLNKQAGITTHAGAGNFDDTLVNALLYHCGDNLSNIDDPTRPGIVHRLDKDTSGLMVVAKNNDSHIILKEQIEKRVLKRVYNAIIWGNILPKNGIIDGYITRCKNNRLKMELSKSNDNTEGKYSLTHYKTLKEYGNIASLMECKLDTGRTHQIRVHFSSRKHPIIGDRVYGGNLRKIAGNTDKLDNKTFIETFPRQALYSKSIQFIHPTTKEILFFEVEAPEDFRKLVNNIEALTGC